MTRLLALLLLGVTIPGCLKLPGEGFLPSPTIYINGQNVSRYNARLGEKIRITAVLPASSSFAKPNDPTKKTYGILFAGPLLSTGSDCFTLKDPFTSATKPFCPVTANFFKGLIPDAAPGSPAKAVELTYNPKTDQLVAEFQVEGVSLCTDPPGCVSTLVGFYSAPPSDPKMLSPLVPQPTNLVLITVNP